MKANIENLEISVPNLYAEVDWTYLNSGRTVVDFSCVSPNGYDKFQIRMDIGRVLGLDRDSEYDIEIILTEKPTPRPIKLTFK